MRFRAIAPGAAALVAVAGLVMTPATAGATTQETATASGSVGYTSAYVRFHPIIVSPLAVCASSGTHSASTPGASVLGFVTYGPGRSTCRLDLDSGSASAEVSGSGFKLTGLTRFGGPVIRATSFSIRCATTDQGSQVLTRATGLTGFHVPNPIPTNYTVLIRGTNPLARPVAKVVLHEVITPTPSDGSMIANLMHITLFPQGGTADRGEIVVGTVSCSPNFEGAA